MFFHRHWPVAAISAGNINHSATDHIAFTGILKVYLALTALCLALLAKIPAIFSQTESQFVG